MSHFLDNAEKILDTASMVSATDCTASGLAILVSPEGAIHMVADSDWPLASLRAHHGAHMAYRVHHSAGGVRVEGTAGSSSCLLVKEPPPVVARCLLSNLPRYVLRNGGQENHPSTGKELARRRPSLLSPVETGNLFAPL